MRLTDLAIRALAPPPSGQKTYFDDALAGFGVRVSQGGTKSFVVMYGESRRLKTVGRYPESSLKAARVAAKEFLAKDKPDPSRLTIADAVEAYLAHAARRNRPRTVADYQRLLRRYLPSGRLAGLSRSGLLTILNGLTHVPAEQYHANTAVSVFLNWCVATGRLESNPLQGVRGSGSIRKRERILTTAELKAVLTHALGYAYPLGQIVALCITTGQRSHAEVGTLQWDQIEAETIYLPPSITKNGREHLFPIGTLTAEIVATVPKLHDQKLFPGRSEGFWNGWSKAKAAFDEGLDGVAPYALHDLRRTFASVHAQLGTPIHVLEKVLNHISGSFAGVAGIYNRYTYFEEMKAAAGVYEGYLRELLD